MPLKRLLTLHGKEFSKKHPATFEIICQEISEEVEMSAWQPSLAEVVDWLGWTTLSVNAGCICQGIFGATTDTNRANFIKYGYKEAIEEGLKGEYEEEVRICGM